MPVSTAEKTTVTNFELDVLQSIYHQDHHDGVTGRDRVGNPIWADCLSEHTKITVGRQISGAMSSLVQKGLAGTDGECAWLTQTGYDAFCEAYPYAVLREDAVEDDRFQTLPMAQSHATFCGKLFPNRDYRVNPAQ